MLRIIRRIFLVLTLLMVGLALFFSVVPQGRVAMRTMLFIPQVVPMITIKPLEWVTREPTRRQIEFPIVNGKGGADLYVPAGSGKHGAVVFFLGVVPPDQDEHRIVALGEAMARTGIVVMIPWLETQTMNRIVPEDIDSLVRAFQYLQTMDRVDPNRVGMSGICTGASMVTVASADERIRDQVRFINFFAGYYDGFDLVKAIGSRSRFGGGSVQPWEPDKLTMRLFTEHLIDGVSDSRDKDELTRLLIVKESPTDLEAMSLSVEAMVVYSLVNGVSFEDVGELIQQLSPKTTDFLIAISPSTYVDKLKARVLIMHDHADRLVPAEESRRLAAALDEGNDTYHTEFSFFQKEIQVHVDQSEGVNVIGFSKEAFKLFLHMYNVFWELS